jgi:hypothetical protein
MTKQKTPVVIRVTTFLFFFLLFPPNGIFQNIVLYVCMEFFISFLLLPHQPEWIDEYFITIENER